MIYRNKHPGAWRFRFLFGLAQIADGLVRLLSLGYLCTAFPTTVSRNHARSAFAAMRKRGL